ncbi:hypothetical protein PUNSTDRAFT_134157 [Punctularia strigosozonata HHB-11173 SS5]|uniref:uncharacterized protein n=1 Tax=Punctularia strigosozonata (strain HHB-11173) TaxID=741275 RepID=UPI00044179C3|nr:uncharacterized protein PUNSTDRAFT_134157 [Punctularia strigosozonata HHB-11173 SS5]EIN08984.1 hypothetical protein PUNSTDRAFT_134157 [Punctularia strigosozonata HHB-11173 SS5]
MYDEYLRREDCPLFHYGLGVSLDRFRAYGIKHKLFNSKDAQDDVRVVCHVRRMVDLIAKRGNAKPLRYTIIHHYHFTRMIAFYTNFNKYESPLTPDEVARIVAFIKAELDLPSDSEALWYWDCENPSTATSDTLTNPKIPKAVKLHMQVTQTENEDQQPVFEDVDLEIRARYVSYATKRKGARRV